MLPKLWVQFDSPETPEPAEVPTSSSTGSYENVSEYIEEIKKSFPRTLGHYDRAEISLYSSPDNERIPHWTPLPNVEAGKTGRYPIIARVASAGGSGLSKSPSKGSISSTDSVGRKRRIEGLVELADDHKRQKVDGKLAFSEFAKEVNRVFPLFHSGPCGADYFTPPTFDLPDHVIDGIYENVKDRIDLLGPMTAGHEKKRERFIDVFIFAIAAHLKGIFIEIEKSMVGTEVPANGDIEYAIKVGEKYVILLEAKREKFDEGKAQNYVECEVAYELNQQHQTYVYGIVTNSVSWFFNKVSGDNVQESFEGLTFESGAKYPSRDSVKSVSSILAGIMDEMKIKQQGTTND